MKFNISAFALATGLVWGSAILIVSIANMIWPMYGQAFLEMASSVYPGYSPGTGFGSVITGTLYGAVDGAIGGFIFAWLYNTIASRQ